MTEPDANPVTDIDRVMMALYPSVEIVTEGAPGETIGTAWFHPQPEHRGNSGWLQGGLAATVLDHVCARTAGAALGRRVVTGTLDLRYPKPVLLADGPYRVRAVADAPRHRMVRVRGGLLDASGEPMVEAKALFVTLG